MGYRVEVQEGDSVREAVVRVIRAANTAVRQRGMKGKPVDHFVKACEYRRVVEFKARRKTAFGFRPKT